MVKSHVVGQAIDALNELAQRVTSVTICWIPAHKGYFGNERADELAKRGSELPALATIAVGKPQAALKADIKGNVYRTWGKQWNDSMEAKHSKAFYYCPNPNKAKYVLKLARLELGRFIRLITGHNNLNYFQNKLGLQTTDRCRLCETAQETFIHFVNDCPRLHLLRSETFKGVTPTNDMKWSVRELLNISYNPTVNGAFEGTWLLGDPPDPIGLDGSEADNGSLLSADGEEI